jgi:hypothetical protein
MTHTCNPNGHVGPVHTCYKPNTFELDLAPEPGTEKKRDDSKFQIITRALSFKLNPIPAPLDAVVLAATETLLSTLLGVAVDFRGCVSTRLGCQEARWDVAFQHRLIRSVLWPRHRRREEADAEELVGLAGGDARKEEPSPALFVQQRRKTLNSCGRGWDEVYWR